MRCGVFDSTMLMARARGTVPQQCVDNAVVMLTVDTPSSFGPAFPACDRHLDTAVAVYGISSCEWTKL